MRKLTSLDACFVVGAKKTFSPKHDKVGKHKFVTNPDKKKKRVRKRVALPDDFEMKNGERNDDEASEEEECK